MAAKKTNIKINQSAATAARQRNAQARAADRMDRSKRHNRRAGKMPAWLIWLSLLLVELFAFAFLAPGKEETVLGLLEELIRSEDDSGWKVFWPLAFGALWATLLTALVCLLPRKAGQVGYAVVYLLALVYAGFQTGYYVLFRQMMWLSEFRYASEGSDYIRVLLEYPLGWYLGLLGLIGLGVLNVLRFPAVRPGWGTKALLCLVAISAAVGAALLPQLVFRADSGIRYAGSDYGRAQSAEAAYKNMFNTHRLYEVCGLYQTFAKDVYFNNIYPLTPAHALAEKNARSQIDSYFAARGDGGENAMTGILRGKNVVLVLMESMDDWMIGEHTPTICAMMDEGINFTEFYTPGYGGVRTFNSEFCMNTGTFLSSRGGYAFDYVTNHYPQSLANQLRSQGYSAQVYHYNDPDFYSRGVFSPAMGYESYISYQDYVTQENERDLYDDQFLFDNEDLNSSFFREGPTLNFIITRSAHLSYVYNEVLSYWGLQKYPDYKGLTGHEEEDCAYLKARLVDDMFARLLEELEAAGQLDNTVIVAMTDHYTYGVDDQELVMARSGVTDELLVERVPCFIWSAQGPDLDVTKTLSTADLLPTLLNLLGVDTPYHYMGRDAFDPNYVGYALFSNGSWVCGDFAYNAQNEQLLALKPNAAASDEFCNEMGQRVNTFVQINNLILETDYYKK